MDDLSVADTAATLGLSEGAVKRCTADGLTRLAAVLGGAAPDDMETMTVRTTTEVHRER